MTKEEFQERLKGLGINKQAFSELSNVPYSTVTNWGVMRDGKPMVVPAWVEPFLNYYEKAQKLDFVMVEICEKIKKARDGLYFEQASKAINTNYAIAK